jgi:hypothetical protein
MENRDRMTLDEIATAAARLINEARAAGLAPPFSLNCHDYGPPAAILLIAENEPPDIWDALQQWADRYRSEIDPRPGYHSGSIHATVAFRRDGISYEITSVIHTTPPGDDEPGQDQGQAA